MATGGNPTCVAARCVVYVSTEAGKATRHPISVIIQFGDACLCVFVFLWELLLASSVTLLNYLMGYG